MKEWSFNFEDLSQLSIGAFALAVPISFSEEAWRLGETLPVLNLVYITGLSILSLALFTYQVVFQGEIKKRRLGFILRVFLAYIITGVVVALVLTSIDKFPMATEPLIAVRRLIVVAMPASMGAIVVDGLDKE
ncbi:DUF2391 family protein [Maridesulfovibrio zosterae]|uniref:DUF2391 family protein n=1 Tax=Maridesulfovibrio zosterae TaxID=82171 RepID=UPI00042768A1|nr:DUF2391 family protein [Maridesulfovibrio zosterae]